VDPELLSEAAIQKAITICEVGAFTESELRAYETYWNNVSTEKGLIRKAQTAEEKGRSEGLREGLSKGKEAGLKEGKEEGLKAGKEEGLKEGKEEGKEETFKIMVRNCHRNGLSLEQIQAITNLDIKQIQEYLS
jgi:flagellar biosynthesis/type III secretory pathway protein FliH